MQKILFIGCGLFISLCPVFASDISPKDLENEKRHKEFIAKKVERMKKQSKEFQTRKESSDECLQRKKIYDEKRKTLLEQFDLKEDANTDSFIPAETFDCDDEQLLDQESHNVSHKFGEAFWNMRIKWCPELWWRFDGLDACEKK